MLMKLAKKYSLWNWNWTLDSAFRYEYAKRIIRKKRPAVVVESGSGSRGISTYAKWPSHGVDIEFEEGVPSGLQKRIKLSATSLPFDDRSADMAISCDMIEHVSADDRVDVIKELFRVTKDNGTVYIAFPCDANAEALDKEINDAFEMRKGRQHKYLKEHLDIGSVDSDPVLSLIRAEADHRGWVVSVKENTPIPVLRAYHYIFTVETFIPRIRLFQRLLTQPLFPILFRLDPSPGYRLVVVASKEPV